MCNIAVNITNKWWDLFSYPAGGKVCVTTASKNKFIVLFVAIISALRR